MNTHCTDTDVAATCFFNALLREWPHWRSISKPSGSIILIDIAATDTRIILPIKFFSDLGSHIYSFPLQHQKQQQPSTSINFSDALEIIINCAEICGDLDQEIKNIFTERVLSSHQFIHRTLQQRRELSHLFNENLTFIEAEQGLFTGHSFHPAGKSREQLKGSEVEIYSPELKGKFALQWLKINKNCIAGTSLDLDLQTRLKRLVQEVAPGLLKHFSNTNCVIPAHPWQWQYLQRKPEIKTLMEDGLLQPLQQAGQMWHPTSSLRAVYSEHCSDMLKFSLNIKLTNSIRTLSVKECTRGIRLAAIMSDSTVVEWLEKHPTFKVIQEPAWLVIQNPGGTVIESSLFVFRDNPFQRHAGEFHKSKSQEEPIVLATLCQSNPLQENNRSSADLALHPTSQFTSNLISTRVKDYALKQRTTHSAAANTWFKHFFHNVISPIFSAQCDLGIIFLAHQQNLVIRLDDGLPAGVYFRDCQGVGLSDLAINKFSHLGRDCIHKGMENHWSQEQIDRYFPYYVVVNSCFAVISALASSGFEHEDYWIERLAKNLSSLLVDADDKSCLKKILFETTLLCKGNFFCYLQNMNENTLQDPAKIYLKIDNPIAQSLHNSRVIEKPNIEYNDNEIRLPECQTEIKYHWLFNDTLQLSPKISPHKEQARPQPSASNLADAIDHLFHQNPNLNQVQLPKHDWQGVHSWWQLMGLLKSQSFTRDSFYQVRAFWCQNRQQDVEVEADDKKTIFCPRRALPPTTGQEVYRRFDRTIGQWISFKVANIDTDFDNFYRWMHCPRVAKFWEQAWPKEQLKEYLSNKLKDSNSYPLIGYFDDQPFGYFEVYWGAEDRLSAYYGWDAYDRGIHLLVGEENFRGEVFFRSWLMALSHYLYLNDSRTQRIVLEPRVDNQRLFKHIGKLGYKKCYEFNFPHKRSALIMGNRNSFIKEVLL